MRRSLYALIIIVVLLAIGFVILNSARSKSKLAADRGSEVSQTVPLALPTALSGFPDIDYIPIYLNASVITTTSELVIFRRVVYEVGDSTDKVDVFYRDTLAKKGWRFLNSQDSLSLYDWADPSGKSPWHLYLEVVLGLTLDNSKTLVTLIYGRYPDIGDSLPVSPDAQQITTSHSEEEKGTGSEKIQVHVTDKTYLSKASPQDLTNYYDGSLLEYGWYFYDRASGPSNSQTGDITSQDGLYFASQHKGASMETTLISGLSITATPQKDGQMLVTLHVEESESPMGGP
jgi:hypothetical protein